MIGQVQIWEIYRTTNNINGKTYIGQHRVKELFQKKYYLGSGRLIRKAIKEYGYHNFSKTVITFAISQLEANVLERYYIEQERKKGKAEYNIENGGTNKGKTAEITKQQWSIKRKGKKHTQGQKEKISAGVKGYYQTHKRVLPKEVVEKMTKTLKDYFQTEEGKTQIKLHSEIMSRKKWYNNGTISTMAETCPEGFVAGRIMKNMKRCKRG